MSFAERAIDLTFELGEGSFGETGSNKVTVSGLRTSAMINKAGGQSMSAAQITVYGMRLSLMNQLSTLGLKWQATRRNTVTVEAGDEGKLKSTVFVGTIVNAWFQGQAAPNTSFHVEAQAGLFQAVRPIKPTSFRGAAGVSQMMSSLASEMGLAFENNAFDKQIANPYFTGDARTQAQAIANAANIEMIIDNRALAIWNRGSSRGSSAIVVAPPGMEGYPTFTSKGVAFGGLFDPSMSYGAKVKIEGTIIKPALGEWIVYLLDYELEAQVPRGRWHYKAEASRPGNVIVR